MTEVPADFPRDPFPGALPGAQLKYLAQMVNGRLVVGLTQDELAGRFKVCQEYLGLLVPYAARKVRLHKWTREAILMRIHNGIRIKNEGFTPAEIEWLVKRVRLALDGND